MSRPAKTLPRARFGFEDIPPAHYSERVFDYVGKHLAGDLLPTAFLAMVVDLGARGPNAEREAAAERVVDRLRERQGLVPAKDRTLIPLAGGIILKAGEITASLPADSDMPITRFARRVVHAMDCLTGESPGMMLRKAAPALPPGACAWGRGGGIRSLIQGRTQRMGTLPLYHIEEDRQAWESLAGIAGD